jgi:hypothetical protein
MTSLVSDLFILQIADDSEGSDYEIRPMDEEQLTKQLKASTEKVDIYDTGMNKNISVLVTL